MTTHTLQLAVAALAIGLAGCSNMANSAARSTPVQGATVGDKPVDQALAKRGAVIYLSKGCYTCHGIGGKNAGPDLLGITDRRDHAWLKAWLMNTDSMISSNDPQVKAMMEEYKWVKMPTMKLNSNDVDALFHYMAQESARARGKMD